MATTSNKQSVFENTFSDKHHDDIIKVRGGTLCLILKTYWRDKKPAYIQQIGSLIACLSAGFSIGYNDKINCYLRIILVLVFIVYFSVLMRIIHLSHREWKESKNITYETEFKEIVKHQIKDSSKKKIIDH